MFSVNVVGVILRLVNGFQTHVCPKYCSRSNEAKLMQQVKYTINAQLI